MSQAIFIDPVDVLYLRGNRLFGGAGEHGEALMPPWPSVASGAVRSHLLSNSGADFDDFANGMTGLFDASLQQALGTPQEPGSFTLRWFSPAVLEDGVVQPVFPLPQDVFVPDPAERGQVPAEVHMLHPQPLPEGVRTSAPLEQVAVLRRDAPAKPASGWWLNEAGLQAWVKGKPLTPDHLIAISDVWRSEQRLGIARDTDTATAAEGQIYTTETIAFRRWQDRQGGFLALVDGMVDAVPDGLLRFGGDGRAARLQRADWQPPEPDWQRIKNEQACRILLSTPGLFAAGWRLPGMDETGHWQLPDGSLKGRVVAAAVARGRTVSGWDLTAFSDPRREREKRTAGLGHPKPAQRSVPVGSVYWLSALEGDIEAGLRRLLDEGLWAAMSDAERDKIGAQRRAEGFNRCLIGAPLASRDN